MMCLYSCLCVLITLLLHFSTGKNSALLLGINFMKPIGIMLHLNIIILLFHVFMALPKVQACTHFSLSMCLLLPQVSSTKHIEIFYEYYNTFPDWVSIASYHKIT